MGSLRPIETLSAEATAFLAIDAARAFLDGYREHLTPHLMERALVVSSSDPASLRPELAVSMCRLANRIMGARQ